MYYTLGYLNGTGIERLQQKLGQLPAGTHIIWLNTQAERQRHSAEFEAVPEAAAAAGLRLEIQISR